jgi:L-threonylcarbamoyladenylate synthase
MGSPVADAVRALAAGRLVVYPTDTLLGLAAGATDPEALERLAAAKGRPSGLPVSVTLSSTEELEPFTELAPTGRRFVRTHLPGPYTVLARTSALGRRTFPEPVRSGTDTVGFRIPDHPLARELARRAGPITATSVNRHGDAPCRTLAEARRTFGDEVAVYLTGGPRPSGRPSTLVDVAHDPPLRVARK